jgi:hypothetical protein
MVGTALFQAHNPGLEKINKCMNIRELPEVLNLLQDVLRPRVLL